LKGGDYQTGLVYTGIKTTDHFHIHCSPFSFHDWKFLTKAFCFCPQSQNQCIKYSNTSIFQKKKKVKMSSKLD